MIVIKACVYALLLCLVGFALGGLLGPAFIPAAGPCGMAWLCQVVEGALCGAVGGAVAGFLIGLVL
jgi:hypothetical protein